MPPARTFVDVLAAFPACPSAPQCRERWNNFVRPGINNGAWTEEDDALLVAKHKLLGNHWSTIAAKIPGRTESNVKNRWYAAKPHAAWQALTAAFYRMIPRRYSTVRMSTSTRKVPGGVLRDYIISVGVHGAAAGCGLKRSCDSDELAEAAARRNPRRAAAARAAIVLQEARLDSESDGDAAAAATPQRTSGGGNARSVPPSIRNLLSYAPAEEDIDGLISWLSPEAETMSETAWLGAGDAEDWSSFVAVLCP